MNWFNVKLFYDFCSIRVGHEALATRLVVGQMIAKNDPNTLELWIMKDIAAKPYCIHVRWNANELEF
ncbi:MAG: hypothetical protein ACREHF_11750 [Rhizomicrobium sp.]